jgi:hypothetical protein
MLSLSAFLGIGVWSSAKTTGFGGDSVFRSGAPRPMKMGTIASPWRYDAMRVGFALYAFARRFGRDRCAF